MYLPSKELADIPVEVAPLPKWKWLADAIREGSKRTQQCFRAYWVCKPHREGGELYATCALGAAALVLYPKGQMEERVGNLTARMALYPALCMQIIRWSDDRHWTRERIADELEKL